MRFETKYWNEVLSGHVILQMEINDIQGYNWRMKQPQAPDHKFHYNNS